MFMRKAKCCFTGHRIMSAEEKRRVFKRIMELVTDLEKYGVYEYYTGGAIGFDYVAAMAVIEVRKKMPHICLELCIPCLDHDAKWSESDRRDFERLKMECDRITYVSEEPYFDGCMQKRNRALVDTCGICIAYCKNPRSGTGATLRYAIQKESRIYNLAEERDCCL